MAGPAAAEAPALGYLAVGLLAAVAWVCFLGLLVIWVHTFGALFLSLAGVRIPTGFFGSLHPLRFLETANNTVVKNLQAGATKSRHAMGYLFHGFAVIQGWIARELVGLARDVYGWMEWFQRAHLPRWVKALIYTLVPPLVIPQIRQWIKNLHVGDLRRDFRLLRRYVRRHGRAWVVAAIAAAFPGVLVLPKLRRDIGALWKWRPHVNIRLRKLERAVVGAGAATLVTGALARLGLKWLRCSNVTKAGRGICRMDANLLESLLLGGLAISGAVSVVEFAKDLRAIEDEAVTVLGAMIREWPS